MPESLSQKQCRFTRGVAMLIDYAFLIGYEAALDYARRCQDCPVGLENSNHKQKLAVDINLFKTVDGKRVYCRSALDYEGLGKFWESLFPDAAWGGSFKSQDANHFSLEHRGVR